MKQYYLHINHILFCVQFWSQNTNSKCSQFPLDAKVSKTFDHNGGSTLTGLHRWEIRLTATSCDYQAYLRFAPFKQINRANRANRAFEYNTAGSNELQPRANRADRTGIHQYSAFIRVLHDQTERAVPRGCARLKSEPRALSFNRAARFARMIS